ncbi:hypothetical protein [Streptomyces sp. CMB-StM0423]|nr:hypothetical protein [Streptomyces sp. CMB-StM0423]
MTSLFSHQQIEHFRAFGYVVLRGLLTYEETGRLTQAGATALRRRRIR